MSLFSGDPKKANHINFISTSSLTDYLPLDTVCTSYIEQTKLLAPTNVRSTTLIESTSSTSKFITTTVIVPTSKNNNSQQKYGRVHMHIILETRILNIFYQKISEKGLENPRKASKLRDVSLFAKIVSLST